MKTRIAVIGLAVILIAAGVILLAGGDAPAAPPPTPTTPLSPATIYRLQVRVYLEPGTIVAAQGMSPEALDQVIAVLETLKPPAELSATHQQVLAGYRYIRDGRQVLATTPRADGVQRAEGEFLVSWGVSRLLEAARQLSAG